MRKKNTVKDGQAGFQEHCIDLPGEKVQCWVGGTATKLKVILRKHRDVIFDINLGGGKSYTLEATESDFYDVKNKKLIFSTRCGKVSFADGEKLHVWISRRFRGALVVKSDGLTVSTVVPSELDGFTYGGDPKEKPAPIIVAINGRAPSSIGTSEKNHVIHPLPTARTTPVFVPRPASAPIQELNCPVVCVIDGKVQGMPDKLVKYFMKGGDQSGVADVDINHIATRNWIWGQLAGTGAYVKDNWQWLRASLDEKTHKGFQLVKAQVHYVKGKVRFYFSGYSNSNTVYGRGGFGPGNERIMTIFSGAGKTESTFGSIAKGVAGTFKGNALISFIFGSATAIAEWKADSKKDGYDLAAALIIATIKTILVAVAVSVIVALLVWFGMVIGGVGVAVIAVGVLTIGIGFGMSYVVDIVDKSAGRAITHDPSNTDGVAAVLAPALREASKLIEKNWEYLMTKMAGDYQEIRFDNAM